MGVEHAQWKFTLFWETNYSDLVSSTLPKDGFKPTAFIPVGFYCHFLFTQRKNPQSMPMRACLSSRFPALRHGFCELIMKPNAFPVYIHCNIVHPARKNPPN